MNFFNDEYTLDIDTLGYKEQADKIRELILNCDTPYTLGISGRWGSGKTSMMKYLLASLGGIPLEPSMSSMHNDTDIEDLIRDMPYSEECNKFVEVLGKYVTNYEDDILLNTITIWYNPWESKIQQEPFTELLKDILAQLSFLLTENEEGINILQTIYEQLSNASNHQESVEKDQYLKLLFQTALTKILSINRQELPENARFVFFIDDLDRCESETIAKFLQGIKQYMAVKRCVFVFGYDKHHVEKSLMNTISLSPKEIRSYLEKLFQATIYLKKPDKQKTKKFIKEILDRKDNKNKDLYDFSNERKDSLADFIMEIVDLNPRRIKSFMVVFYFHYISSEFSNRPNKNEIDLKRLALITYLKIFHEPVYSALENMPELLGSLLDSFEYTTSAAAINHNDYFFFLELKSHLKLKSVSLKGSPFTDDEHKESKFLTEVYDMQGKHKSHDNFKAEFENHFKGMNQDEFIKYL